MTFALPPRLPSARPVEAAARAFPRVFPVDQLAYFQQLSARRPGLVADAAFGGVGYQSMMLRPALRESLLSGKDTPATLTARAYTPELKQLDAAWVAGQQSAWTQLGGRLQSVLKDLNLVGVPGAYKDPRVLTQFPVQPAYGYNPAFYVGYRVGGPMRIQDANGLTWLTYVCLRNPTKDLTPALFQMFMQGLADAGFHGDGKLPVQPGLERFQYNNIVVHGASQADARLAEQVAAKVFGAALGSLGRGLDVPDPKAALPTQDVWSVYLLKHRGDIAGLPPAAQAFVRYL